MLVQEEGATEGWGRMMRLLSGAWLLGAVAAQDSKPPPPLHPPPIPLLSARVRLEWAPSRPTPQRLEILT